MKKLVLLFSVLFLFSCSYTLIGETEKLPRQKKFPTDSFVNVTVEVAGKPVVSGSGSVIENTEEGAYVLTANHVCRPNPIMIFMRLAELMKEKDLKNKVLTMQLVVRDVEGNRFKAKATKLDAKSDLCMLGVPDVDKTALDLAEEYPKRGQVYYNMSAPLGVSDGGTVPIFEGFYSGEYEIESMNKTVDLYSIPTQGGASGSPVLTAGNKVVGVVSMRIRGMQHMMLSVKYQEVWNFIKSGGWRSSKSE